MPDEVREVEVVAAEALPAAEVEELGGWRLRYTRGVTRRANSVWPNAQKGPLSLEERLEAVEAFYAARGLPARFQVTPAALPENLDEVLAARGYTRDLPDSPVCVQTASLAEVNGACPQEGMPQSQSSWELPASIHPPLSLSKVWVKGIVMVFRLTTIGELLISVMASVSRADLTVKTDSPITAGDVALL